MNRCSCCCFFFPAITEADLLHGYGVQRERQEWVRLANKTKRLLWHPGRPPYGTDPHPLRDAFAQQYQQRPYEQ